MTAASPRVAKIIVDTDVPHLEGPFEYQIPPKLRGKVVFGQLVRVKFGARLDRGWVVGLADKATFTGKLSPISRVLSQTSLFDEGLYASLQYLAEKYAVGVSQLLSLAIPPRHAASEKQVLEATVEDLETQDVESQREESESIVSVWLGYEGAQSSLAALAKGQVTRLVWNPLPQQFFRQLLDLLEPTIARGQAVLIVAPTVEECLWLTEILCDSTRWSVARIGSEMAQSERYRTYLEAQRGQYQVVVGTRSAVWIPVKELALVVVIGEGDDHLEEQRAPYCDAVDVAVARSHCEKISVVAGGYSRSVKAAQLVETGWATSLSCLPSIAARVAPIVRVLDIHDIEREGKSALNRLPDYAFTLIREAIKDGPVLVQVSGASYSHMVTCQQCHVLASCTQCGQTLREASSSRFLCRSCTQPIHDWHCPHCQGQILAAWRPGAPRIRDQLKKAFPGISVVSSSSESGIIRAINSSPAIVVATAGAEPRAEGGYAAVILTEVGALAFSEHLWAVEEAARRSFNALALASSSALALVTGEIPENLGDALRQWNPARLAASLLKERAELGFFPTRWIVALEGQAYAVNDFYQRLEKACADKIVIDSLGTFALAKVKLASTADQEPDQPDDLVPETLFDFETNQQLKDTRIVRMLVRCGTRQSRFLMRLVRDLVKEDSKERNPIVRVIANPTDLISA